MQPENAVKVLQFSCFYLANSRQMQRVAVMGGTVTELFLPCKQQADATSKKAGTIPQSCFYLANSRQMQQAGVKLEQLNRCFYLANSRQMQQDISVLLLILVVFTLQTAGRCNHSEGFV